MKYSIVLSENLLWLICSAAAPVSGADVFLGQGTMAGEVTDSSVLLQTRLTAAMKLNDQGGLPGTEGLVLFQWSRNKDFVDANDTPFQDATAEHDFIVRAQLNDLDSNTTYYYRAAFGVSADNMVIGPTCSFRTLPGAKSFATVKFIVGSCMNYNKFMHGRAGNAGGPLTATGEDKRLGFPAFVAMREMTPDFFVGTGDIVYYDNKFRRSETVAELRRCWHEQFRFKRMIDFFQHVPTYWSKDDHDFRFNDSDNASDRLPLPITGIELFREQLPIATMGSRDAKTYRTHRVSKDLQIWLTEGRDYRSDNRMKDGPSKTMWGTEQRQWLKRTLKASDAKWKLLISPTPMVGPDMAKKSDNHASLSGFRYEANAFFSWLQENEIENFMTICGDRHWQYHSIHPSGVEEFACGALNDENSRLGIEPGDKNGTDPNSRIEQPFISPKPSGGFLFVTAGSELKVEFFDDAGTRLYQVTKPDHN